MNKNMKKILIVDDDIDYLYQTKLRVESFGFETITAESQKEAELLLGKTKPDLAILDLMMESEDSGFILAYRIKKMYPDVPVIIATAAAAETGITFDLSSDAKRQWVKADLYMDKGIRTDQLQRRKERGSRMRIVRHDCQLPGACSHRRFCQQNTPILLEVRRISTIQSGVRGKNGCAC